MPAFDRVLGRDELASLFSQPSPTLFVAYVVVRVHVVALPAPSGEVLILVETHIGLLCGNDPVGHYDYLGQSWLSKLFKKAGHAIGKFWNKFRGTIISAALNVLGGAVVSAAYDLGNMIAHHDYSGAAVLALFGRTGSAIYGTYRQFRHGKFRNNLGDFLANVAVSSATQATFQGGPGAIADVPHALLQQARAIGVGALQAYDFVSGRHVSEGEVIIERPIFPDGEDATATGPVSVTVSNVKSNVEDTAEWWEWKAHQNLMRFYSRSESGGSLIGAVYAGFGQYSRSFNFGARVGEVGSYIATAGLVAPVAVPALIEGGAFLVGEVRTLYQAGQIAVQTVGSDLSGIYASSTAWANGQL